MNKYTNSRAFLTVCILLEVHTRDLYHLVVLTTGVDNDCELHLLFTDASHTHAGTAITSSNTFEHPFPAPRAAGPINQVKLTRPLFTASIS